MISSKKYVEAVPILVDDSSVDCLKTEKILVFATYLSPVSGALASGDGALFTKFNAFFVSSSKESSNLSNKTG